MANLSPSWQSATVTSRTPSPQGRALSILNRSTSPIPKAGDTATMVAFRNARDAYRKSLSEKDLKRIMLPTGPEDVITEIEKWQQKHLDSKFATGVRSGLGQLQRFSASIDMLAQGTPSPGCLLWGSIKLVLTIVQDAVQAYEQLCKALIRMIDCLPRIEIYTETFVDSGLVAECVNEFYVSAIRFWAKACKFYSRHRLWRVLRTIWNDFDTEFGHLEADMIRNREKVEGAALADHIGESKATNADQQRVNSEVLEVQSSTRKKEITAWLAPVAYDVEYFSNDLAGAKILRHPKTCVWVLEKPEMMQCCSTSNRSEESLLWICANPGAGKTILSSFLIDHFESEEMAPIKGNVLYFFCKNTDVDKNTPTTVVRSLVYQLYKLVKDRKARQSLNDDLGLALDRSGQQKAVNFTVLWQLFSTHITNLGPVTIILDALDECQDPKQLIEGLKKLSEIESITVIVTSRKEMHLHNELKCVSSIEITPEDIDADIAAFVEAKVEASARLSNPLVHDLVITKLCSAHDGMFLWVYLVLKELKSCISVAQVQDALAKLPTGLDGIYKSILQRLQTTLTRSSLDLCSKILTWVVSAAVGRNLVPGQRYEGLTSLQRPLSIDEIRQALIFHYEIDGDTLLADDRSFPYSDKDLELICGSMVTIRKGTLQVVHLTVKEFLRSPQEIGGPTSSSLLVDPEHGSLQLTLVCLRCIANDAEPLVDLQSKAPQIDWALEPDAIERRRTRAPFLEYATFSWLVHLVDCRLDDLLKITPTFQEVFSSPATFHWVEMCMASQPDSTLRLLIGIDEIHDRYYNPSRDIWYRREASSKFLASWCVAMSRVFEEYGAILARRPWEIYLIDLCDIFSDDLNLRRMWQEFGETPLREKDLYLKGYQAPYQLHGKPRPHLQLQRSLQTPSSYEDSIFLIHDEDRSIYIWGQTVIEGNDHCIYVQHDKTGQRLPPAKDFSEWSDQTWRYVSHAISSNGRHLALYYCTPSWGSTSDLRGLTVVWRINENISFKRRMSSESWAKVVFSHASKSPKVRYSSRAIMFKDDHLCITPSGELDLLAGSRRPLPDDILNHIENSQEFFYSCSGRFLFTSVQIPTQDRYFHFQARRLDPFGPSRSIDFCWIDKTRCIVDVSPAGRYLVLGRRNLGDVEALEEETLYLHDTNSNETIGLPFAEPLSYWQGKFHFSQNETRLIAFIKPQFNGLKIMIWDGLATTVRLASHTTLDVTGMQIWPHDIHVNKAADSAVMVTGTRSIQRIELGRSIELLDVRKSVDNDNYRLSTISRDGSHWALVSYGPKGGEVQIVDLMSPDASCRHFYLEWSQSESPAALDQGFPLPFGISPDLSVIVIDAEVFDLTTTNDKDTSDRLTRTSFTIEAAPALLKRHRYRNECWGLVCRISPCNSYVAYVGRGDQWGDTSRYSSDFFLYHIDLQKRTSARVEHKLPKRLASLSASFHPSLPLLAISYGSPSTTKPKPKRFPEELPPLSLAICDLKNSVLTSLDLPKGNSSEAMAECWSRGGWLPRLLFSDCGTFAYLDGIAGREYMWFQKVRQMDINPVSSQCIETTLSLEDSLITLYDDDNTNVELELIKLDETGFWIGTRPAVKLQKIASYSSHCAAAYRCLLLGATDDEKMRLFITPRDGRTPFIKTLSLTFTEARSRLQKEWERLQATSQD